MNIVELSNKCHLSSKLAGFWENTRTDANILILAINELCNALESDRLNKKLKLSNELLTELEYNFSIELYNDCIKNTKEEELIDSMMIIFDLIGGSYMNHVNTINHYIELFNTSESNYTQCQFSDYILKLVTLLADAYYYFNKNDYELASKQLAKFLVSLNYHFKSLDTQLNWIQLLHLKIKYNSFRGRLYGKSY